MSEMDDEAKRIATDFAGLCNIAVPKYSIVDKAGDNYLAIHVGAENEPYANHLREVIDAQDSDNFFAGIFLKVVPQHNWLVSHECQLLQRILSESLTVGRATLESDFHRHYIPSLAGEETKIYTKTNHVVFGRRGAGKSSLVLYACNQAKRQNVPFAWIALQQYRRRDDLLVVPQVLYELVESLSRYEDIETEIGRLRSCVAELDSWGGDITREKINQQLPIIGREARKIAEKFGQLLICMDDLHLVSASLQPYLLSCIYAFSRGNNIFLKVTAIENLTQLYDQENAEGLQTPGDAQVIRLDRNLVDPSAANQHIESVISGYVSYVGIPSLAKLCGKAVRHRLTWVSAGVPRDALYVFNNAITKAIASKRKSVTVTDVNMAASDSLTEKESQVSEDFGEHAADINRMVNDIRDFCVKEIHSNAFLAKVDVNDPCFRRITQIADLRFIHMLHPGITPDQAGQKYQAFMLDYAFYTGFRKAQSMSEFKTEPEQVLVKELRKLKKYRYEDRLVD
jgi:hypothetical protein